MASNIDDVEGPSGPVNVRAIVDEVFQGDIISKISQGSALKALAYKTVKLSYDSLVPPLDDEEAFFITEQFMGGWLSPLLDNINKQPEENKDKKKIRENTDFDKEDGIPDKIGEFNILEVAKLIGKSHISEVVAGKKLDKVDREQLIEIKKKFMNSGKSMTSTLGAVIDSPDYTNFIKHAITSAVLYLSVVEPNTIREQAKTDDETPMSLAMEDYLAEVERENRPEIVFDEEAAEASRKKLSERTGTSKGRNYFLRKGEWFNILKRDD
jgi:hypothetical protein